MDDGEKPHSLDQLEPDEVREVYLYLRRVAQTELIANRSFAHEATSLANQALENLLASPTFKARDPEHLRRVGVQAIRWVLVDARRRKNAEKRGGGRAPISMSGEEGAVDVPDAEEFAYLEELMETIDAFGVRFPDAQAIVELAYLTDSSASETAHALGVTPQAVSAALVLFQDFSRRTRTE